MSTSSFSQDDSYSSTNSLSSPESHSWSPYRDDTVFMQSISPTLALIKTSVQSSRKPEGQDVSGKKERRRTQNINTAFADLRGCIPNVPTDTKLSKIKTLRLAISYIQHLMQQLNDERYNMVIGNNSQFDAYASFCQQPTRVVGPEKVLATRRNMKRVNADRVSWILIMFIFIFCFQFSPILLIEDLQLLKII